MPKKLNSWKGSEIISYLRVIVLAFTFSVLLANCSNNGSSKTKADTASTPSTTTPTTPDTPDTVNWLVHWHPIPFTSDPNDNAGIEREKQGIRVYVRGWLAEYNADDAQPDQRKPYVVNRFTFDRVSASPLAYQVKAFLTPPAKKADEPGGHLQPPSPPPPR